MEKRKDEHSNSIGKDEDEFQKLVQTLEQRTNWDGRRMVKYNGYWFPLAVFRPILSAQKYFKAEDSDIILTSNPKSGTTWLMALTFSIANRSKFPIDQSPLLTRHTHTLVPSLEYNLYFDQENPNLEHLSSGPRIFSTHVPFDLLPRSVLESEFCKIIYVCRNPLDQFISHRHFLLENSFEREAVPLELDEAFDMFCRGIHSFGPFWDHIPGYWKAHLENPEKVLFLKYEDLKKDIGFHVRKIAEFLGCPFSAEEEEQGMVEAISRLCSFENLTSLQVNKSGYVEVKIKNSSFFRKGEVGDWINFLTPSMAERVENLVETKFCGALGLSFNYCNKSSC